MTMLGKATAVFDDNGKPHQRRARDPIWRFFIPVAGTVALSLIGWGVSVENRVTAMASVQVERGPKLTKLADDVAELLMVSRDPSSKPQTKTELYQLEQRINRLEERFNNIHIYLLQVARPVTPVVPPSKRGELPFKVDGG